MHLDNDVEKEQGYFLSKKGIISKKDGKLHAANFEDKLYVGNIHSIENHLYWNDEELADDDQVINVVTINGPVTRDGGAVRMAPRTGATRFSMPTLSRRSSATSSLSTAPVVRVPAVMITTL